MRFGRTEPSCAGTTLPSCLGTTPSRLRRVPSATMKMTTQGPPRRAHTQETARPKRSRRVQEMTAGERCLGAKQLYRRRVPSATKTQTAIPSRNSDASGDNPVRTDFHTVHPPYGPLGPPPDPLNTCNMSSRQGCKTLSGDAPRPVAFGRVFGEGLAGVWRGF